MAKFHAVMKAVLVLVLFPGALALAADQAGPGKIAGSAAASDFETITLKQNSQLVKISLFSPAATELPIAEVNEEKITLGDLQGMLAELHKGSSTGESREQQSLPALVDRLIDTRLILQEGRNIGLDQLPEVAEAVKSFSEAQLRGMVMEQVVKEVKPDPKEVKKYYREMVREWKFTSLLFTKEDDAKAFAAGIKSGGKFDQLMAAALREGKAKGGEEKNYIRREKLLPQVGEATVGLKKGDVSKIIQVASGFAIFRIDDLRYPEDAEIKAQAEKMALSEARYKALADYRKAMIKKYVKLNEQRLKKLDFEAAKPGFAKLLEDRRVLAEIKGEAPVTVANLAEAIRKKFYHGVELAIKEKKINKSKDELLENILVKKVFGIIAREKGYDQAEGFKKAVQEHEDSLIFGFFVEKAVRPDVKVLPADLKEYYQQHLADYTYPEMIKLDSLVFTDLRSAQSALQKLRKGADFQWLRANAEGQAGKDAKGLLEFGDRPLVTRNFPENLQKSLAGVRAEDYRLYDDEKGHFYLLYIRDVIPSTQQPFEEVQEKILKPVYGQKLQQAMADWTARLRKAYEVKVFIVF